MIKGVKSAGPVHGCWWLGKRWDDEMEKHMHDGHKLGGVGGIGSASPHNPCFCWRLPCRPG